MQLTPSLGAMYVTPPNFVRVHRTTRIAHPRHGHDAILKKPLATTLSERTRLNQRRGNRGNRNIFVGWFTLRFGNKKANFKI